MSQPVQEYISARIGQTWTAEDAAFVVDKIRKIEQLAEAVVLRAGNPARNSRKSNAFALSRNREAFGGMSGYPERAQGD